MTYKTNYIRLWRDKALLYFPNISNHKGSVLRLGIDQLPWSAGKEIPVGTTYRIILGIIPRYPILSSILPIVQTPWQAPLWAARDHTKTYIAQFSIDHCGIPHPASAWIHLALTNIKTFEVTGYSPTADQYIRTKAEFENKLARHNRPIDDEKLSQLIHWLQGFLPRDCDIAPKILVDTQTTEEISSILELMNIQRQLWMGPTFRGFIDFLHGDECSTAGKSGFLREIRVTPRDKEQATTAPRLWPTADNTSLPADIKELIMALRTYIRDSVSRIFVLTAHNISHRTSTVCEVTALHLIENAQFMLTSPRLRIQYIDKWPATFNNHNSMGLTVFSDDTQWLDELQAIFSKSWAADPTLSEPPLAQRNPITPRDYLGSISKIEKTELAPRKSTWRQAADYPLSQRKRKIWRMKYGRSPTPHQEEQIKKTFGPIIDSDLVSNPLSVEEAIGVLRTYIKHCTPYYRERAEEYEQLANRRSLTSEQRQRRSYLYKHLSVITPIRLTTFADAQVFLHELRGYRLGLAIVDCSGNVTREQIALICTRFQHVILIGPDRNKLSKPELPQQFEDVLCQKHGIDKTDDMPLTWLYY